MITAKKLRGNKVYKEKSVIILQQKVLYELAYFSVEAPLPMMGLIKSPHLGVYTWPHLDLGSLRRLNQIHRYFASE